ncbi:MerR family transcriptional regulator [Actinokineospora pegani]|uniref:MerR family transcriptional regulator n=1 Tax=Actinokineospora pegani TaxID=2654637 RepID=UPI0012E9ABAF|nr:MerR family transcriptional regulator [Actinokineospora pegani]
MPWSTRQIAELGGTTLKAVRHYHRIGLLEEPERAANGYKRYKVRHLIRLLRIRRLVDMGVTLSDIAAMEGSEETEEQTLRALDAELAASIERQQRMREDLAAVLRDRTLVDLPPGFDENAARMSEATKALILLYSRVLPPPAMDALRELYATRLGQSEVEFEALPADADEQTRQRIAEAFAVEAQRQAEEQPELEASTAVIRDSPGLSAIGQGVVELYNIAQLDVLRRFDNLINRRPTPRSATGDSQSP